jgi:ubiquinone/menaquinone biosynthesis C-methylase UbiE
MQSKKMTKFSETYSFKNYSNQTRWASYWHQIDEIFNCKPNSILEIGIGDSFLSCYIKNHTKIEYASLDKAKEACPDILGSVENIPLNDESVDLVCAFEILEHLPYEQFETSLKEIFRVTRKNAIISLPYWGRHFSFEFRLPYFKKIRWQYKLNIFPIKHAFDGEHYWEIGKEGYPLIKIKKNIVEAGFSIKKDFLAFYSPYHYFFVLEK